MSYFSIHVQHYLIQTIRNIGSTYDVIHISTSLEIKLAIGDVSARYGLKSRQSGERVWDDDFVSSKLTTAYLFILTIQSSQLLSDDVFERDFLVLRRSVLFLVFSIVLGFCVSLFRLASASATGYVFFPPWWISLMPSTDKSLRWWITHF